MSWFAFAPDGRSLVSTGQDGVARSWECPSGLLRWVIPSAGSPIHCGAFHADGSRFITGADDGLVRVFRLGIDEPVLEGYFRFPHPVTAVAAAEDGTKYAIGTTSTAEARSCVVLAEGQRKRVLIDAPGVSGRWYLAFSPDTKILIALNVDGHTREECRVWLWESETDVIRELGHAPTCRYHGMLRFLDARTLSILPWPCVPSGEVDRLSIVDTVSGTTLRSYDAWSAAPDGNGALWVFSREGVYNTRAGREALVARPPCFPGEQALFSVAGETKLLAVQSATHNIALYSLESGSQLPDSLPRSSVEGLSFSPCGTTLALCATEDSRLFLFDPETGKTRGTQESAAPSSSDCRRALAQGSGIEIFSPADAWPPTPGMILRRFGGADGFPIEMDRSPQAFALSYDARMAAMCNGKDLILVEMHSGTRTVFSVPVIGMEVAQLVLSLDYALISGVADGRGHVLSYRLRTGEPQHLSIPPIETAAPLVALAAASDCIALAGAGWMRLTVQGCSRDVQWDDSTPLTSVALSPDGKQFAAGTLTGRIVVGSVDGEHGPVWLAQEHPVLALTFSDDGFRLASGSNASAVVWDMRSLRFDSEVKQAPSA